ncbi:N-acetyltransferase [Alishewanella longhuensis]|uniref:N-acetyltransferase n=1 Tax=Alishewanella longhuensis TaxID=1091037 RepID=A0ABQ3KVD1_9ALTE|nr:GNAT family N-acetyltransferase [Alishewanella longhuensis]GHG59117.1 N-acetyltransferase [Alishewanella longhuensis]
MLIEYQQESTLALPEALTLYRASGISRPTTDEPRMAAMLQQANLLVTARANGQLIGLARCLTDYSWVTYIADLLVDQRVQQQGIGRQLLAEVRRLVGPQSQYYLHSAPTAMDYYPKVGFTLCQNAFVIARESW